MPRKNSLNVLKSSLKNMVVVLFLVTFVASLSVTIVYDVTKEPIAISKEKKIKDAIAAVVPEFDNNPSDTKVVQSDGKDEIVIYTAKKGDEVSGYAIETYTKKGFGGKISLMVGFRSDGTIYRVETLSHNETPGLGNKIERSKSDFSVQFEGKNPEDFKLSVKKDGGDVDAITASTISSRAFCDAIDRAYAVYKTISKNDSHE